MVSRAQKAEVSNQAAKHISHLISRGNENVNGRGEMEVTGGKVKGKSSRWCTYALLATLYCLPLMALERTGRGAACSLHRWDVGW